MLFCGCVCVCVFVAYGYFYFLTEDKENLHWVLKDGLGTTLLTQTRYVNNSIQVPASGNYFVYSFVTFSSAMFHKQHILNHYVYRRNRLAPELQLLLMDKQTQLGDNLEYQSSFLTAVLQLEADDRIETKVTDPSAIYPSTFSNYMGLFKI